MPWTWRRRPQVHENISEDSQERKGLKRRSLRNVFSSAGARNRRLEKLKLTPDSPTIERRDVTPPNHTYSSTAETSLRRSNAAKDARADFPLPPQETNEDEHRPRARESEATMAKGMDERQVVNELTGADAAKMFVGAPRFTAESVSGVYHGSVQLPEEPKGQDFARDCPPLKHPIHSLATVHRHVAMHNGQSEVRSGQAVHDIDIVEVPSMLAAHGVESGTIGFNHFMQMPVADSQGGTDSIGRLSDRDSGAEENLLLFHSEPEKLGLRKLGIGTTIERLAKLSKTHINIAQAKKKKSILDFSLPQELYDILFDNFLTRPSLEVPKDDPSSLKVQLEALAQVLGVRGIWFDFSQVESRIRLGQLLWGPSGASSQPQTPGNDDEPTADRDVILLQITLACELLLRLDALSTMDALEVRNSVRVKANEVDKFRSLMTAKPRWDLVLARRFLDNVQVKSGVKRALKKDHLRYLPKRFFFPASLETPPELEYEDLPDVQFLPRHQERQLDGLMHFANSIGWPHTDELEAYAREAFPPTAPKSPKVEQRLSTVFQRPSSWFQRSPSNYATPVEQSPSQATDYFGSKPRQASDEGSPPALRPQINRVVTKDRSFQLQSPSPYQTPVSSPAQSPPSLSQDQSPSKRGSRSNAISPLSSPADVQWSSRQHGWLTRAYLTGLILPGESLQHHLISALLENSPSTLALLGDTATLYGGLVLADSKRSYWSRASIVGRVLAGSQKSQDGWGWVGTTVVPMVRWKGGQDAKWKGDGWVDVISDPLPAEDVAAGVEARIKQRADVERSCDPLAGHDASMGELKPDHFTFPVDAEKEPLSNVFLDGLKLERRPDDTNLMAVENGDVDEIPPPASYKALMVFSSWSLSSEVGSPNIPLSYDVYFISAFPCVPPLLEDVRVLRLQGDESASAKAPGHPLHVSYRHRVVPASDVMKRSFKHPAEASEADVQGGKEILVLDVRGSAELEMLARAWCASKGKHAVIGRVGVTCLACCVREARAAGVSVVIRL